jgi:hypothetical protein
LPLFYFADTPIGAVVSGMKHRPLALLLVLVLLCHWAGLSWLSEQAQQGKPLVLMRDPLFTRMIAPAPAPRPEPAAPRRAQPDVADLPPLKAEASPDVEPAPAQQEVQAPAPVAATPVEPAAPMLETAAPAATPTAPPSDSWPADTRVSYRLSGYYRGDIYGNARVQWQREQSRYQIRLDMNLALVLQVSMISQGEATQAALLPSAYEERFLWDVRRLTFEGGYARLPDGRQLAQPGPQALQDTASQFVELSHRFSSGRDRLQVGSQVQVWLARPQGTALWTYDVVAEEILQTPELGPVPAFHLRPRPIANPAGVITAEIWFAPSLQYLPVRVRIALGDDNFVDLMVERIEQGAAPAEPARELVKPQAGAP